MSDQSQLFNRTLYRTRRNRAAALFGDFNFLKREACERLADRLDDMTRAFPLALDLGCHRGELADMLRKRGDIETLIQTDLAEGMKPHIVCDEEFLPFAENSFDLIMSVLSLHHVNDLPGALIQIQQALKPDGLFLAILPGANTLKELRESVVGASAAHGFALSPRVSPFVEVRDAGALLQRAKLALPVIDSDAITVNYDNAFKLMADLRGMGEGNVLLEQSQYFTPRTHIAAIANYYQTHFAQSDGTIPATFEFVTLTGWKPHASQQQPAKRGSGKMNLRNALS